MRATRLVHAALAFASLGGAAGCGPKAAQPFIRATTPPVVTAGELDARKLLAETAIKAERAGAGPLAVVAKGTVSEGDRLGAFVDIPQGACLLGFARGASSIEDVDIAAFADEGSPLVVDEGPDPKPTVLYCPREATRLYLAVHTAGGDGLVALGAALVPQARASEVAKAVSARGALGGAPRRTEAWPGLDEAVIARRKALGGTWDEQRRTALPVDAYAPSSTELKLDADSCVDILVVPDDDVALIDVAVQDDAGREVARAREGSANRSLLLCSRRAASMSLVVRPHVGRGLAATVVARSRESKDLGKRADVVWIGGSLTLDKVTGLAEGELERSGYGRAAKTTGAAEGGRRAELKIAMPAPSGCSRVDVVGGEPLSDLTVELVVPDGRRASSADGAERVTLYGCASRDARLLLETRGMAGPYAILITKEPWESESFTKEPIASARMLTRLAPSFGAPVGKARTAKTIRVAHDAPVLLDYVVPGSKCIDLGAGASGEGVGVTLRAFDVATQKELDRSHGPHAAAVRACASTSPMTVRAEVTVSAGVLSVVVGDRVRDAR